MNTKKLLLEVDDILEHVSNAVDAERSTFFLLNQTTQVLESIVAQGLKNLSISVLLGNGIAGRVAREGLPFLENDAQNSPILDKNYDGLLNFLTKSTVCVPVRDSRNQVIGVLQCLNKKSAGFTKKDVTTLNGFAATISLIVKNAQLYHASEDIKNNFSTLLEVFAAVSSELDLDNLIQLIMLKAAEITNADRSSLFFMDEETNELWTKYAKGLETKTVRTKKGIVGLVASNKKAYIVNDPY